MSEEMFKISLRENGEHSIKRGLEYYREYERSKDQMLLKDAIIFLHHGIELLMKEILVRHSEYLIFEDLKDVPRKQKEADRRGVGIFFLDSPPKTVTYDVAISRVDAFIKPQELDDSLRKNLDRLNRLRNLLEHYAIEASKEEVVQVLESVRVSILKLFEKHIGPLTQLQTPEVNKTWNRIRDAAKESRQKTEEIRTLMEKFNGQIVPGRLFHLEGEVTLPKFKKVLQDGRIHIDQSNAFFEADILAEPEEGERRWMVEIKLSSPTVDIVHKLASYRQSIGVRPWLVAFNKIPTTTKAIIVEQKIMCTGVDEIEELKKIVE